ncbi:MAG: rhodanese-related sulfurtransferase [Pseudomonadota bacterium]
MITVAAFYRFAEVSDPERRKQPLAALACAEGVRGTVLIASEGVNGTIAGPRSGVDAVIAHLRAWEGFSALEWKESHCAEQPFRRLKVRVKREIVTLGAGVVDHGQTGTRVAPEDWGAVLDDPEIAVIDCRNRYEIAIGQFDGALDPETDGFTEFPERWAAMAPALEGKRIAMYCTGGIRCEKASAWLRAQGVPEVLQLDGGILRYLERVPEAASRWQGECFVFDERVAVDHALNPGSHTLCHACGRAVSPEDRRHPAWRQGVSCPACIDEYTDADRARFAERQRQQQLARARGVAHLAGADHGTRDPEDAA